MKKFMKWVKGGNIPKSVMSDNSVSSEIKKEEIERYDTASQVCHHHNNEQYPNIKAIEHCEDCNTKMCYMCGSKHMVLGHNVKWSQYFENLYPQAFEVFDYSVGLLNRGFSGRVYLDGLECPCGTKISEKTPKAAQCSACGTWTCSKECHDHYLAEPDKCTFHHNFLDNPMEKAKMAPGTPVCKTSKSFVFATIGEDNDHIYVQRGYRQYGNPLESTYRNIEINDVEDLDYIMHNDRMCKKTCDYSGTKRENSPVYACRNHCFDSETQIKQDFLEFKWVDSYCDCDCDFCSSGRINRVHTKMDCLLHCRHSEVAYRQGKEHNAPYLR